MELKSWVARRRTAPAEAGLRRTFSLCMAVASRRPACPLTIGRLSGSQSGAIRRSGFAGCRQSANVGNRLRQYAIDGSSPLIATIQSQFIPAFAKAGQRGASCMRQPAGSGDEFTESRPFAALQQRDDARDLGSVTKDRTAGLLIDGRILYADKLLGTRLVRATGFGGGSNLDLFQNGVPKLFGRRICRLYHDRLGSRGRQFERVAHCQLIVPSPDRRVGLRSNLLQESKFLQPNRRPHRLGPPGDRGNNHTAIFALRCAAEENELRVIELDGHV